MNRSKQILNLLEKLSVRGYVVKGDLVYLFGKGRYPNAIIDHDGGKFSVLFLKKNDIIHPGGIRFRDWEDFEEILDFAKSHDKVKKIHKGLTPPQFLELLVTKEGVSIAVLLKAWPDLSSEQQENSVMVGDFELLYQNEGEVKLIGDLLKDSCKILTKYKLQKLCYGKVFSTQALQSRVVADYNENTDSIRISNKGKKNKEAVGLLIHEIGHRHWHKNLTEQQKKKIRETYYEVKKGSFFVPAVGDIYENSDGVKVEIVKVDPSKRTKPYIFIMNSDDSKKYRASDGYFESLKPIKMKNKIKKHPLDVSSYGKTSPEEYFSEVFSHALTKQNKDAMDWLKYFI